MESLPLEYRRLFKDAEEQRCCFDRILSPRCRCTHRNFSAVNKTERETNSSIGRERARGEEQTVEVGGVAAGKEGGVGRVQLAL